MSVLKGRTDLLSRRCRLCGAPLSHTFADLGQTPLANSYVAEEHLGDSEALYPLHAYVCSECLLVQLEEFASPQAIFSDYAYFSSFSDTWQRHCDTYSKGMVGRFDLGVGSLVIEIASNDGCLLSCFRRRDIPVLGVEPARNIAAAAEASGVPTVSEFFCADLAERLVAGGHRADLLVANNVLAHVPDLHTFVEGMRIILAPTGIVTVEFPHLLQLMEHSEFDTIYHEHFSYFSLKTVERAFEDHELVVCDVDELAIHGGSLRVYARHREYVDIPVEDRVAELRGREADAGLHDLNTYLGFSAKIEVVRSSLLALLNDIREQGKTTAAYGAPAKGNTLLNYCGIGTDLVAFTVDRNPHKQGRYLPGSRIPVYPPEQVAVRKPDYLLILPWNIRDEIMEQNRFIRDWNGKFIIPIPQPEVVS